MTPEYKDSGHRPPTQGYGPFEAYSVKPNGVKLRTFHRSIRAAQKRLRGNPRHSSQKIVDHRPVDNDGKPQWVWVDETGRAVSTKGGEV